MQASQYFTPFAAIGALVVAFYAWQKFNEPTFPNRSALRALSCLFGICFLARNTTGPGSAIWG
jgi:hypothetical protein